MHIHTYTCIHLHLIQLISLPPWIAEDAVRVLVGRRAERRVAHAYDIVYYNMR